MGDYCATWSISVNDMETIIPYAIERAIELGEKKRAAALMKLLNEGNKDVRD